MAGTKYDDGKPRTDLVPASFILSAARAFKYGADKYADRNWEEGLETGRLYGALIRHLLSYSERTDYDDESGLHHLDHAAACLAMLIETQKRIDKGQFSESLDTRTKLNLLTEQRIDENKFSEGEGKETPRYNTTATDGSVSLST